MLPVRPNFTELAYTDANHQLELELSFLVKVRTLVECLFAREPSPDNLDRSKTRFQFQQWREIEEMLVVERGAADIGIINS
jgi:hypothetical protein